MNTLFGFKDLTDDYVKSKWGNPVDGSQYVLIDEVSIHYKDQGNPNHPAIIAIHGIADSLHTWNEVSKRLVDDYRFIRLDIPGFGLSGHLNSSEYSLERWMKIVSKLLDHLDVKTVHLLGNSLGGYICWNFAVSYPDKVDSLMLLDPAAFPLTKAPWIVEISKNSLLRSIYSKCSPKFMTYLTLKMVFANKSKITNQLVTQLHEIALRAGNRKSYMDIFEVLLSEKDDYPDEIKQISTRTLVIFGAKDLWIPPAQLDQWKTELPSVQTKIYEGVGHCPQLECPDRTVEDLVRLINQT